MATILVLFVMASAFFCAFLVRKFLSIGSNDQSIKGSGVHASPEYVNVTLPNLFQAFLRHPPKVNPHYNKVKLESEDWLCRACSFGPKMKMKVNMVDFSLFCAIVAPFAAPSGFRTMCDWGNWVFPFDDMFDDGHMKDQPEKAAEIMDSLMGIMEGRQAEGPKMKLIEAHDAIVQEIAATSSLGTQKRFASAMRAYSSGVLKQVEDRSIKHAPTLEDIVLDRRGSIGVDPLYQLIEHANGLNLPDEVFEDPNIQELQILGEDLVSISNDILSYKKEELDTVNHNMVAICRRDGMSAQEAFDAVGSLLDQRFRRWETVEKSVPSWGEKVDAEVRTYIDGIKGVVCANTYWSFACDRYFGCDAAQVKMTRRTQVLAQPPYLSNSEA